MEQAQPKETRSGGDRYFIPMLLGMLTLLVITGGQLYQLSSQEKNLSGIRAGQEKPMEDARRVRAQFDSITTGTARLAVRDNPNAIMLLKELEKQGVTVQLPDATTE